MSLSTERCKRFIAITWDWHQVHCELSCTPFGSGGKNIEFPIGFDCCTKQFISIRIWVPDHLAQYFFITIVTAIAGLMLVLYRTLLLCCTQILFVFVFMRKWKACRASSIQIFYVCQTKKLFFFLFWGKKRFDHRRVKCIHGQQELQRARVKRPKKFWWIAGLRHDCIFLKVFLKCTYRHCFFLCSSGEVCSTHS